MTKEKKNKKTCKWHKYLDVETISISILILIFVLGIIFGYLIPPAKKDYTNELLKSENYSVEIYKQCTALKYQSVKSNLIDSIDKYIKHYAKNSVVNASVLLELCDKYDVDVRFALAQGRAESGFATAGMGGRLNSIFNVGAFDNKTASQINNKYKYKHPDFSIEPWLKLLTTKYLYDGRIETDLMIPGNFKTKSGHRYASAKDYESKLADIYTTIDNTVKISDVYGEYKKYKILVEM